MQFLFTLLAVTLLAAHAYADKLSPHKPPQSFESMEDFYVIEGAGLFPSGSVNALPSKMWKGSERDEITQLIKDLPATSKSPVIQDLIEAVLFSESNTTELEHYEEVTSGNDLLTLRIYKLMEAGLFSKALELYSVAIEEPHHQDIAKAGILAMLSSGEKSIACLEMKTLGNMNMSDPFWPNFMAYCNYTLSERPSPEAQSVLEQSPYDILRSAAFNPNFIYPYTPLDWDRLSLLERNVLIAENKIEAPVISDALLESIPPRDIAALLKLETFKAEDRLKILLKAYEWGIVESDAIAKAYADKALNGDLPALYRNLDSSDNAEERDAILLQVIDVFDRHSDSALVPFAPFFAESSLKDIAASDMTRILRTFYRADISIAPQIIGNYIENSSNNIGNAEFFKTMQAVPMVLKMPESQILNTNMQNISIFHKNTHSYEENVIENLDKGVSDVDNADKVYEKGLDETTLKEQEDAQNMLLKALNTSKKRGALGQIALLSITVLSDQTIREADEKAYSDSLEALQSVNLKEFSRKMAIERLIGD